jgi:hypothetical protein
MVEIAPFCERGRRTSFAELQRMPSIKAALAALILSVMGLATSAWAQVPADMIEAAKAIQAGCVKRGEDARVCSCSVGIAYSKLDPKVFKLVPQIEPLLDQKNQVMAIGGLVSMASANGLGVADLQNAYDAIRTNRDVVRQICRPLAPGAKTPR